jgi:hypothetical protein
MTLGISELKESGESRSLFLSPPLFAEAEKGVGS